MTSPEMIITIDTVTFVPETARVNISTTVTWLNQDPFSHDVISGKASKKDGLFASGFIEPGDKWSHRFDSAGIYSYFCSIHPWKMHGVVIVNKKQ
jgi:plastocyanin